MNFSYKMFEDEFSISMKELEQAFAEKDYLKTISYVRFLCRAYYQINYKFTDDRLEEILEQTATALLGETRITDSKPETVIFYDGFGVVDRGLADNYVSSLAKLGYQVTWIMHYNAPDLEKLQLRYREEANIIFRIVPRSSTLERMQIMQGIIKETAPRHVFLYIKPWDVCGIAAFSTIKGEATRFLIDLTGHAFWLGKCAMDYAIGGGREYIEINYRKIAPDKLIRMSNYIPNSNYPFEGMPFDVEKFEFIFSGGSTYKIEGDSTYQEIVEYILYNFPALKFVFASNGTCMVLENLKNKFPGQFFLIPERKDLNEILKRAKLYLGTYPINGGLMIQYPIANNCLQLCLSQEPSSMFDPKTLLLHPEKVDFVYYKKEDLLAELNRLLQDQEYYIRKKAYLKEQKQVIDEETFQAELDRVLKEHRSGFPMECQPFKVEKFLQSYRRTATYEIFCEMIYNSHNPWIQKRHPDIMEKMHRID